MKSTLVFVLRLLVLVIMYFLSFSVISAALLPPLGQNPTESDSSNVLLAMLVISLINTLALVYVVSRSRWSGWKLTFTMWFVLFGVLTLMSQIETAVFIRTLPPGFLLRLFLVGFLFAGVFAAILTLVLGKRRQFKEDSSAPSRLQMPIVNWIYKLAVIALVYVVLYFTFGHFIAWSNPAVRQYYGGGDYSGFLTQLVRVWHDTPWLFALQIFRAMLWTAIAVPVIRMMKGAWWEAGLAVALLFSIVMNTQLLLPNPLMPYEVRMAHLLETATSNFLFAWILVWLLKNEKADHKKGSTFEATNLPGRT